MHLNDILTRQMNIFYKKVVSLHAILGNFKFGTIKIM